MIQFVKEGPQIPEEIAQALRDDNLVFFCGAGISKPNGLPLFHELAEKVCEELHISIEQESLLRIAKKKGDYAGIFDLLESGRIPSISTTRKILREKVIEILNKYNPPFNLHKALLELSALKDNTGHRLVTTNFDKLFLKAQKDLVFDSAPKLAPPRKEQWKNLTFLHGVVDEENDSEGSNLILTRRDFGLAYLYDNWASRFISLLFQDFTILFVGYSADDPTMNYLVSAISYENQRRKENENSQKNIKKMEKEKKINSPIYAFVGYKGEEKGKNKKNKEDKWKQLGVEPIPYKIKGEDDHSLLHETIKEWAELKKTGLAGKKIWLTKQLEKPYKEETDRQIAENVISTFKIDEKLSEYLPKINLSSDPDPKKIKAVDISWLKAFSGEKKKLKDDSQSNGDLTFPKQYMKTEISLVKKLTCKTASSYHSSFPLWEPLSLVERNIAKWLLHHLDKNELIHWLIEQISNRNGIVSLHPEFKDMLKWQLDHIQEKAIEESNKRKVLFWQIVTTQKENFHGIKYLHLDSAINDLNKKEYSYEKVQEFLSCLEPAIGFEKSFYAKELESFAGPDKIYEARLTINASDYFGENLKNEKALLFHAEDFSNLLKKAMELAKRVGLIYENGEDIFYIQRPSIEKHEQNKNYYPWTCLIDLVKDSFDLAMKKDKKLADFLLNKWQLYPYSIFYRLIFYAITKYSDFSEEIATKLFEEKPEQTLWSVSCKNEVLKFLRNKKLLKKESTNRILSSIMKGPSRPEGIEEAEFIEYKERDIFLRLHHLKLSNTQFPEDVERFYKKIPIKYSFKLSKKEEARRDGFSFYVGEPKQVGSEKRYHNMTCEEIFKDLISKKSIHPFLIDKKEEFRSLSKDLPDKAFKVLSMFKDNDITSTPYWGRFLYEISIMNDLERSKDYFLKSFKKLEKFSDKFLKEEECLWSLIHGLNSKGGLIHSESKERFKKWWKRILKLSPQELFAESDDISTTAINSNLGKLSETVFSMLWSDFSDEKIPKEGKVQKEIKEYFEIILKPENLKKDPSIFFHFGSHLSRLWYLDRDWTLAKLKPLIDWKKKQTIFVRKITNSSAYSLSKSKPPEGVKDTTKEYNMCVPLWKGYLFHDMFLSPDFLEEFKEEFFQLFLNYEKILSDRLKIEYADRLAQIFFITTGGYQIKNIFDSQEIHKIIQNINVDILVPLSRQIWHLLKDSGDKSENLWSKKIKPWIKEFWPSQTDKMNSKIAENLCFSILHCGKKLPEAFDVLGSFIEGRITQNSEYIFHYIVEGKRNKKNNKKQPVKEIDNQDLEHIYNYPKELLQILNWNFPENKIYSGYQKNIREILDELKAKNPDIEKNEQYKKLLEKIT